ncbi:MAG TPA: glycosyltransferase [Stellaceae bacterium]|nr:glycosyltransferase [Stellaceae bacterium]
MTDHPGGFDVDVILVSWNRAADTVDAVRSALDQKQVRQRVIVIDQGSEPAELAQLEAYLADRPQVVFRKLGRNVGVPAGRNAASALGQAPFIVALDSDAVFADRFMLRRAVDHMAARPALCAIGFRITNYFTGRNDELSWDYPGNRRPDEHFPTTRFIGAGHCIRRSVFERVGRYDESLFFSGEELDLCYRMLGTGHRIEYVPAVEILHKVSPDGRVRWRQNRYRLTVRNHLYTLRKFGAPWSRLALATGAFVVRGTRNGAGSQALAGAWQSLALCAAFERSTEDKSHYRLSAETWRYIHDCEPTRRDSLVIKLARQFQRLPHQ